MQPLRLALLGLLLGLAASAAARPPRRSLAAAACEDKPPPSFTCAQQRDWGKCGEAFMAGYCDQTCGRCGGGGSAAPPSPSPSAPPAAPASPAPANSSSPTLPQGTSEYGKVLGLAWQFIYAQRSGRLSSSRNNPIAWRGDDHLQDPVVGGFFDAGDHLKLNFPLGTSLAFLAWGALEFADAYAATGQAQAALDNVRWGADYLMACHTADNTYIAQIGDPGADHAYWGRPEDQRGARPAFTWDASHPASDAASSAVSALASASLLLKPSDPGYAAKCLDHARRLFAFAAKYEGKYSESIPGPTYVYPSSNFLDDLAFAAGWLWRATGESSYLDAARGYLERAQYQRNYFVSWDAVFVPADILLHSAGAASSEGVDFGYQIAAFLATWQKGQNGVSFSPGGLAIAPLGGWGNLRYSANAAFMMALHAKATNDSSVRSACLGWARGQLDYMLGLKGSSRSFVVGYGNNPPASPHHRAASCPWPPAVCDYQSAFQSAKPNPHVLTGALVGGPPGPSDAYEDKRSDFQQNEVAFDYSSGFIGALAGLVQQLPAASSSSSPATASA